jgi:hypothetical protein
MMREAMGSGSLGNDSNSRTMRCPMLDQCLALLNNLGSAETIVLALLTVLVASCLHR